MLKPGAPDGGLDESGHVFDYTLSYWVYYINRHLYLPGLIVVGEMLSNQLFYRRV